MKKRVTALLLILAFVLSQMSVFAAGAEPALVDEAESAALNEAAGEELSEGGEAGETFVEGEEASESLPEESDTDETVPGGDTGGTAPGDLASQGETGSSPLMEASPRIYLSATTGGSISGSGPSNGGAATIFSVEAGKSLEVSTLIGYGLNSGDTLTLTAVPQEGYTFKGWYKYWNSTSPELISSDATYAYTMPTEYGDQLTAAFTDESAGQFENFIKEVTVSLSPPAAGTKASDVEVADRIFVNNRVYHCTADGFWYDTKIQYHDIFEPGPEPYKGTFEAGKTYYIELFLEPDDGYRFYQGGELGQGSPPTTVKAVNAGLPYDDWLMVTNYSYEGEVHCFGEIILSFTPEVPIELPAITFTPPVAGESTDTVSAADCVTVPEGVHYDLGTPVWGKNTSSGSSVYIGGFYSGTFEEGETYYVWFPQIMAEEGYFWNTDRTGLSGTSLTNGTYVFNMNTGSRNGNGITTFAPAFAFTPRPAGGQVTRLFGSNRYSTSLAIAEELRRIRGSKFDSIVLATGENYPDALAGGYLATVKNAPIILIRTGKPTSHKDNKMVAKWIKSNLKSGGTIYVLGSTAAVPKAHVDLVKSGFKVKRLEGKNRFGTNAAILNEIGANGVTEVIVTTGRDFPDALCASALDKPLLIVETKQNKQKLDTAQKTYLSKLKNPVFYIVGPTSVVPKTFESQLKAYGSVERIAGDKNAINRSEQIARRFFKRPAAVALAVSSPYPDGLCGGAIANKKGAPLLLVKKGSEAKAAAFVKDVKATDGLVFGANKDTVVPNGSVNKILPKAKIVNSQYK